MACVVFDVALFQESRQFGIVERKREVRIRLRTVPPPRPAQESPQTEKNLGREQRANAS